MFTEDLKLKKIILISLRTESLERNWKVAWYAQDVCHNFQEQQQSRVLGPRHFAPL